MVNAVEKFFGRFSFIPYRSAKAAEVDPEIFSHLQLHIAAHPDIETSCVLANLFRAIYMDSSLFYAESLERLDATSRSLARDLMRAKLLKAFSPEEWDEAHRLISQLPPERGGIGTAGPRESGAISAAFALTEMEVSTTQSPAIGSSAWIQAWFAYFKSLARRRAAVAFARASQKGGFDGFKYLWGAPAAASVIAGFFGVALLDERLGLRRVIVSSPPVQWIAELIETETQAEPAIEVQVENARIARLQPKAPPKRVPVGPKASRVEDAAISWRSEELAQHIATGNQPISEAASPTALDASEAVAGSHKGEHGFAAQSLTALDASEGVAGRIARPETASSQDRPKILVSREGGRPEQQTRPKPVARLKPPVVIVPPDQVAPPPVSDLPPIAKVVPVLHEVQSDLPKTPALEELPPVTNAAGPQGTKSGAAPVRIPELTPARSLDAGVGTEQAAPPAFIQRLQSGGRDERKDDAKHAIDRRGERVELVNRNRANDFVEQLDRSGPSDRVERLDRFGPGDGLERVERVDRSGLGDRVERVDRSGPSDRVDRVERVARSGPVDRVERIDRSGPSARLDRVERIDRSDRVDRVERVDRSGPGDRVERIDRSGPSNRAERFERIDRSGKSGRGG